jgi:hypothetical protein
MENLMTGVPWYKRNTTSQGKPKAKDGFYTFIGLKTHLSYT